LDKGSHTAKKASLFHTNVLPAAGSNHNNTLRRSNKIHFLGVLLGNKKFICEASDATS
jgi:hypothetical protein